MTLIIGEERGFTLVEMLVVLAIIAMFLGISTPFVAGFGKGLRLRASAREISSVLRIARSNAVTFRRDFSVVFDTEKNEYWIEDSTGSLFDKAFRLPRSVRLSRKDDTDPVTFQNDRITFKPTGSIEGSGGTITITDNRGFSKEIIVVGPTGKISIR